MIYYVLIATDEVEFLIIGVFLAPQDAKERVRSLTPTDPMFENFGGVTLRIDCGGSDAEAGKAYETITNYKWTHEGFKEYAV